MEIIPGLEAIPGDIGETVVTIGIIGRSLGPQERKRPWR